MPKVNVYIDGLNLYYRALIRTNYKWLDLSTLARLALPRNFEINKIRYYCAHVSGRVDPEAPKRQNAYLRALATLPDVEPFFGRHYVNKRWAGLADLADHYRPTPDVVRVWKTEEKGSDVNLGVHLVRDAFQATFEVAAVLTNDTDLTEAFRIVVEEVGLPIVLLSAVGQPAKSLVDLSQSVRHVGPYLGPSQFPDPVIGKNGQAIPKPATW